MKRPGTMQEYLRLVDEALEEIDDLKASIEFDDDEMDSASGFVDILEARVGELRQRLTSAGYEFEDRDLPFMEIVSQQSPHFLPFKALLELINETHRKGLGGP